MKIQLFTHSLSHLLTQTYTHTHTQMHRVQVSMNCVKYGKRADDCL